MGMILFSFLLSSWWLIIDLKKKLGFLMFHYVLLASASQEERGSCLMILRI